MNKILIFSLALFLFNCAPPDKNRQIFSNKSGIAINGFDVLSYFKEGKAVKGDKKYQLKHKGSLWYFSSAENKTEFASHPEKFLPQYGGYCAWAMAGGKIAEIDPKVWSLYQGKLYLNYDKKISELWQRDKDKFIMKADKIWPQVLKKLSLE